MFMARSLSELNSYINVDEIIRGKSVKCVVNSASTLFNKAKEYNDKGNLEEAYIYFMKFYQCFKYIQASEEYKKDKIFYNTLMGYQQVEALKTAEDISKILENQYAIQDSKVEINKKYKYTDKIKEIPTNIPHTKVINGYKMRYLPKDDNIDLLDPKQAPNSMLSKDVNEPKKNINEKIINQPLIINGTKMIKIEYISPNKFFELLANTKRDNIPPKHHAHYKENCNIHLNIESDDEKYLLIIDIRPFEDFIRSHINYPNVINIPKDIIGNSLSIKVLNGWFNQLKTCDWKNQGYLYNSYERFDYIVIIDGIGQPSNPDSKYQKNLIHHLIKDKNFQGKVCVLDGGYSDIECRFPYLTINEDRNLWSTTNLNSLKHSNPIIHNVDSAIDFSKAPSKNFQKSFSKQNISRSRNGSCLESYSLISDDDEEEIKNTDKNLYHEYPDLTFVKSKQSLNNKRIITNGDNKMPFPTKSSRTSLYPDKNLFDTAQKYEVKQIPINHLDHPPPDSKSFPLKANDNPDKTYISANNISTPIKILPLNNTLNDSAAHKLSTSRLMSEKDIRNPNFLTKYGPVPPILVESSSFLNMRGTLTNGPNTSEVNDLKASSSSQGENGRYTTGHRGGPYVPNTAYPNALNATPYLGPTHPPTPFIHSSGSNYPERPHKPAMVGTLHRVRSNPDIPKIHTLISESLAATDDDYNNRMYRLNLNNWTNGRQFGDDFGRRRLTEGPPTNNYPNYVTPKPIPIVSSVPRPYEDTFARNNRIPMVDRTLKPIVSPDDDTSPPSIRCSSSSTLTDDPSLPEESHHSPGDHRLQYDYGDDTAGGDVYTTLSATTSRGGPSSSNDQHSSPSSSYESQPRTVVNEVIDRSDASLLDRAAGPSHQTAPSNEPPWSSRLRSSNAPPPSGGNYGLTGILNTGNSCYINSTLQSLSHTVPLAEYFVNRRFLDHLNRRRKGISANRSLAAEFANVCGGLWSGRHQSINPISFTDAVTKYIPGIEMGVQQDCHEFLTFLLDGLHEDLNVASTYSSNKAASHQQEDDDASSSQLSEYEIAYKAGEEYSKYNDSIIVDLMNGQLKSVVICQRCSQKSITFDTFQGLSLPLPSSGRCTLQDCLRIFLSPEPISDWKCPKCNRRNQASKELFLWKIPPILIIHLMRFKTDGHSHTKISTAVDFPLNGFDLTNYCAEVRKNERLPEYTLYAVSNHFGSLEGGHYTAFCKNPINQRWYKYDDQQVMEISSSDVRSPAAYLLFYTSLGTKTPDFL